MGAALKKERGEKKDEVTEVLGTNDTI